jgi:FKBP-type peptidyl-prolyl cis-trans isomerase FkpA
MSPFTRIPCGRGPLFTAIAALSGIWLAVQPITSSAAEPGFANDDQKFLYYWGTTFGKQLEAAGVTTPEDLKWVNQGLQDQTAGKAPSYGDEYPSLLNNYLVRRQKEAARLEQEAARSYLQEVAKEKGAVTTDSGLVFRTLVAGRGAQPDSNSRVKVQYTGTLRDGTVFDSSLTRGKPLETTLDKVIACWSEAIPRMRVGGKAKFTCPPDLAYGERGNSMIPGGSALTFEVELLEVQD